MSAPDFVRIEPLSAPVKARVQVPGSKSYTNRALPVAALARGRSELSGALFSDDTVYMSQALRQLGVRVDGDRDAASFVVDGCDGQLQSQSAQLYVGNAGTAARFLTVLLAIGQGSYELDGIERMRQRPMADLFVALRGMGVRLEELGQANCLPVRIDGGGRDCGDVEVTLPGSASSQFISGLLLSAPYLCRSLAINVEGTLVSQPYLDMTQAVMQSFGVELGNQNYERFSVASGQRYRGAQYVVEPDASAASYFFAAAALTGGVVTVEGLGSESRQGDLGFARILEKMGAEVVQEPRRTTVRGPSQLRGVEVDMRHLSDTAQTLAVVAPFAQGPTRITGIGFIRRKETDRVGHVVKELKRLGVDAEEEPDGMLIRPSSPRAGRVATYDDHRMAMSFALLGLKVGGIEISDPGCTSKTFPNYWDALKRLRNPGQD